MAEHFAHGFLLVDVGVDAAKRGEAEQVLEVLSHLQLDPLESQEVIDDGSPIGEGGRDRGEKLNGGARRFGRVLRRGRGRGRRGRLSRRGCPGFGRRRRGSFGRGLRPGDLHERLGRFPQLLPLGLAPPLAFGQEFAHRLDLRSAGGVAGLSGAVSGRVICTNDSADFRSCCHWGSRRPLISARNSRIVSIPFTLWPNWWWRTAML